MPDSEKQEIKKQLKANDVIFYAIHCAGNIIAPDPDAEKWQRHIIDAVHSAAEMGCELVLTHAGSMYPNRNTAHPMNWSKEAWQRSVNALKRICKDTAGIKVDICLEPVNTESINNPWAQKRIREDVGDPRIGSGLDITNMVFPNVAFRMTEMINTTFDLLEDQIRYIHAKDFVWNDMLPGMNWAMNGTGNMDYEQFLARISRLKREHVCMLVEFLGKNEEYDQAQRNIRSVADKLGVKIHGKQA
jgi:sugar phosphate isomerase/epimerase